MLKIKTFKRSLARGERLILTQVEKISEVVLVDEITRSNVRAMECEVN
jgi:hypothetical protein